MNKNSKSIKYWLLAVASIPFIILAVFYVYTKDARADLSKMKYPRKMYATGVDSVKVSGNKYAVDSTYHTIKDFDLVNQYNQSVSKATLHDKIIVANFFFTSCPTICPKMSEQLARVQSKLIRDDRVVILSFTIDPQTDSVAVLKNYAEKYDAVPGKWHFLYGNKEAIYNLAKESFKITAQDSGGNEQHQGFIHSEKLVLVDPNWNIRGYYDGTSENKVNIMMGDILLLLEEFKR